MEQLLDEIYGIKPNEEELRARTYQPTTITELRIEAIEDVGLPTLMEEALILVTKTLGVEYGRVLELQPDAENLLLRSGKGWKEGFVGHATVPLDSPSGYTLEANEPMVFEDVYSEARFSVPPLLHEHGVRSSVLVPICDQEQPLGVLGADTTEQRAFTEDEADYLQAVAEVLAAAR
ncbi:MAG: GAF domain-containing protein [Rubrobacter sp.]|nr:GAF domain-containing protein [Rubrobacter sp.]